MSTKKTLSDDERRALLVDRQLVGPRGRADRTVLDVAESVGPLHSTDPASVFLQFAARSELSADELDRALYDDKVLLRHTTLRRTVHLLTPDLARAAHGAYNHRLVPKLRSQLETWFAGSDGVTDEPSSWLASVEDAVVEAVTAHDRPSGTDLARLVPGLQVTFDPAPGKSYNRPTRITSKVLELLIAEGRLARDRPNGGVTSGAWTYGPITDWLPDGLPSLDPASALADLLVHKIGSMPGCSTDDLAWWTGLPKGQVTTALATIDAEPVARDDGIDGWVAAVDRLEAPEPGDDTIALLPGLDATPMGCRQRDWFLGPHHDALFDRNGNIGPTVWWRGRIVGGWTHRGDGAVVTELLEAIPKPVQALLADEARRIEAWLGPVRVNWRYPTPLQRSLE